MHVVECCIYVLIRQHALRVALVVDVNQTFLFIEVEFRCAKQGEIFLIYALHAPYS